MPRGDGTGPMGMGSMTGRGAGFCTGSSAPGYASSGMGFARGRGRGFRRVYNFSGVRSWVNRGNYAYDQELTSEADEKNYLKNQKRDLESQLNQVKKQLKTLDEETE